MEEGQNSANHRTHSRITHGAGPNGDHGGQGNNQHSGLKPWTQLESLTGQLGH